MAQNGEQGGETDSVHSRASIKDNSSIHSKVSTKDRGSVNSRNSRLSRVSKEEINAAQARADLAIARAKKKFAEQRMALEAKELEVRRKKESLANEEKIAVAEAKSRMWEDLASESHSNSDQDELLSNLPEESSDTKVSRFFNSTEVKNNPTVHKENAGADITCLINSFRIPKVEVPIFRGDPLEFPAWLSSFNSLIEARANSPDERLNLLIQHLGGEPKSMVRGYLLLQSKEAYMQAKSELKQRYGNNAVIAKAFTDKLTSVPKIDGRDPVALRRFSDALNEVVVAKRSINELNILNYPQENAKLVAKLPYNLQSKWRSICMDSEEEFPSLERFSTFVQKKAKEANNPIFQCFSQPQKVITEKSQKKRINFSTAVSNSKPINCPYCEGKHSLDGCEAFEGLHTKGKRHFMNEKRLCFCCAERNHRAFQCKSKKTCKHCGRKHLTCLHYEGEDGEKSPKEGYSKCTQVCGDVAKTNDNSMILPVWLKKKGSSEEMLIYCILDPQSNTSFVREDVVEDLNLNGQTTYLKLSTMHAAKELICCQRITDLQIISFDRSVIVDIPVAFTREEIPALESQIPTPATASIWKHLESIAEKISPFQSGAPVAILLGNDVPKAIRPLSIVAGDDNQPYAQESILGWGIIGTVCKHSTSEGTVCHRTLTDGVIPKVDHLVVQTTVKERICPEQVQEMFNRDFIEHGDDEKGLSVDDNRLLQCLKDGIVRKQDGHYKMPLPLRCKEVNLPDNRSMALKRLHQLGRRFKKNEKFKRDYCAFMDDVLVECAEPVPKCNAEEGKINYVPHTGIYHPRKPDKICVVFDCSARANGISLNDCLLQGPDLTNDLLGVLCRFRRENIAIMGDVKSMFHQFRVLPKHRDLLRFLWWKDGDPSKRVEEYRMSVHLFGAVSSPGCANFGLKRAADDGEETFGSSAAQFVREDFYVDDGLKSVPTEQEAIKLIDSTTKLCAKAGLTLHKWITNSRKVLDSIPKDMRAKDWKEISVRDPLPLERALGIVWCVQNDTFRFRVEMKDVPLTRRGMLSTICSIYDPLGFAAPVILRGKAILQEL
ncbi:uncharacterized protein LOC117105953 [Anneissia japonica]|uniref:uncharacterized protein LOC117105953 n=1 Tax=Anneissia japonica TaxID=1529436 RepID=UPI00142566B7|nr:uncharacterized protein LOC117105953 [Anneissia japonica]XP_033103149.1 uncharacterized protein LOC117105953 [Anneissia japonica]XP_033103150.1 uncharacterized protein LOC117105953 [Anneissia japonica]